MAELAQAVSTSSAQRADALRVRALTHLQSGQFEAAAESLRAVLVLGSHSPEIEISLRLSLVRAYIEACDWAQASEAAQVARSTLVKLKSAPIRTERHVELLAYLVKLGLRSGNNLVVETALNEMDDISTEAQEKGALTQDAQLEAIASRAVYLSFTGSTEQAFRLLCDAPSSKQQNHRHIRLLLNHSLVALRLGRWEEAEALAKKGMRLARRQNDLLYAADCQNNLACVRYEQGRWAEALADCQAALQIYDDLGSGEQLRLTALLNVANIYFYTGALSKAQDLYGKLLTSAKRLDAVTIRDEIIASLGLLGLMTGSYDLAATNWLELQGDRGRPAATQDWYKQTWFRCVVKFAFLGTPMSGEVQALADDVAQSDLLESLKLGWLATLLGRYEDRKRELEVSEQLLKEHRLGWFAAFSRRWFNLVMNREIAKSTALLFQEGTADKTAIRPLRSAQRQADRPSLPTGAK